MKVTVLYNQDADAPADDPGYAARADIEKVAAGIAAALRKQGHAATQLPCWGRSFEFVARLAEEPPDLVFNLCESLAGDSRGEIAVPAILDSLGIPYTGSPSVGLALALHKHKAKAVLTASGVPTPQGRPVRGPAELAALDVPLPCIVKPAREDASVGIGAQSVVRDRPALEAQVLSVLARFRQEALVERYVEGREINAAVLGGEVLPLTEIDFSALPRDKPPIVTYEAKWDTGSEYDRGTVPRLGTVDEELRARVEQTALGAFAALGLSDYGRVDMRIDAAGNPWVIDVNPNCDLSPGAGFSRAAEAAGLSYEALMGRLVDVAMERVHADPAWKPGRPTAARGAAVLHRELRERRGRVRARARRAGPRRDD